MNGGSPDLLTAAMTCDLCANSVDATQKALLTFVRKVTDHSESISPDDVNTLRSSEISGQVCQRTSEPCYALNAPCGTDELCRALWLG
jgi:hypothetical protein